MDWRSASLADRVCDWGAGVQCPKDRKPMDFIGRREEARRRPRKTHICHRTHSRMIDMRRPLLVSTALFFAASLAAQATRPATPTAIKAIREADLRRDMETMAGDAFRGREAGTNDERDGAVWGGGQTRQIGLP